MSGVTPGRRPGSAASAADPLLLEASDAQLSRISYFASYHDAFYVAQRRAGQVRIDYGLESIDPDAQVSCDVASVLREPVIGRRLPRALYRIFMLPPAKSRQGHETRCQVVEPEVMTTEELRARGHL